MEQSKHFYVITGGPGAGKTTLINSLHALGYQVSSESGRAIIRAQLRANTKLAPLAFAEQMLEKDLHNYKTSPQNSVVVFDRGIPDTLGYLMSVGAQIPKHIKQVAREHLYNQTIFVAPFWPEIYKMDAERKQTLEEARETYEIMREVYIQLGYNTLLLPKVAVNERVDFVRNYIKNF